jgi:chromate transport protein ChrA
MSDDIRTLLALALVFAPLSLLSIGGGASLLAEIEHHPSPSTPDHAA